MKRRVFPFALLLSLVWTGIGTGQEADTSFGEPVARPDNPEDVSVSSLPQLPEPVIPEVTAAVLAFMNVVPESEFDRGSLGPTGPALDRDEPDTNAVPNAPEDALPEPLPAPPAAPAPRAPRLTAADIRADERWPTEARNSNAVIANRQIIAFYGHPRSRLMGVLGETPIDQMAAALLAQAAEYDELNGDIGVAPAFHMIYGTVYADASVGILNEERLMEYINYAAEHGILVFLDHQIGGGTVADAITSMLPYLRYPNVNLAIDPEWATTAPGREIGHVTAQDINNAQLLMSEYIQQHHLPGDRILVVHQFNWRMISNRDQVRADYPGVELIHNADGFGQPAQKYVSWEFNVQATNIPLKGFKLFYPKAWRDGGYDEPLLTPAEVLQLDPVPVYVQYQ